MLIEIDLARIGSNTYTVNELDALENIGTVAACGYHLVLGSRKNLFELSDHIALSARSKMAYAKLAASYALIHGATLIISERVVVSDSTYAVTYNNGVWTIPLGDFSASDLLGKPELLAENADDARFYIGLGEAYKREHFRADLPLCIRSIGGGGSTTANELSLVVNGPARFVFCITDADRSWSGGNLGAVFTSCKAVLPANTWSARLSDNYVRTIENLLVNEWLTKTNFYRRNTDLCERVGRMQATCSNELAHYSNLKSVFNLCQYRNHVDLNVRNAFSADIALLEPVNPCGNFCMNACFSFGGIHASVKDVANFILEKPALAGRSMVINSSQEKIGRKVFEYGVAWTGSRV